MIGRKRFWTEAQARAAQAGGFGVYLDDRPLRTPEKRLLVLPSPALAGAIAAEWAAIEGEIQPDRLPFTRAANSAIDRVAADPEPVIDALAAYGDADLLCYRADGPEPLQARQAAQWDPWLDWSRRDLSAPLFAVIGVMHQPQPAGSLAALRDQVAGHDAFGLAALHDLVTLSGSLVLALAVSREVLDPTDAWELSRLDERWQAEQWGRDAEADRLEQEKYAAFLRAEQFLALRRAKG